ncbi:MAG: tetratricopeptide repeat protein [Kiritimatiellae bacterium]|nr:tetratricopeptide repeat protein [Kiritimatiellia bacterium]
MKRCCLVLAILLSSSWVHADEISDMKKEIDLLKCEVAKLRNIVQGETAKNATPAIDRKAGIRRKYEEDKKTYSDEQLREIEKLYQSANKNLKSPEAKEALKSLIEKYPKANRTGCAVQYMGQMSSGEEKETYLKLAIKDFGDCYYGSGVQVGAYARLYLAYYYKEIGKEKEAKTLFDEIKNDFPDAVNHKGKLLVNMLPI